MHALRAPQLPSCFNRCRNVRGGGLAVVDLLAANPAAGDEIAGTGGCRKVRVAGGGKGKSGGYRVITFFTGESLPVFLVTVFAKAERANLSRSECNALRMITKAITDEYKKC
jgi:hypothetical protein